MKKPLVATLALVLAGLFALPGVASAQEGEATVAGHGWLWARGEGSVDIDMRGRIRLHVDGDVTVTDNAGDMRIRLRGGSGPEQERATNVSLDDFRGTIHVHGSNLTVSVDGKVVLTAHGRGRAVLVGDGVYRTRHRDLTPWDGAVDLEDAEVAPA